MEESAEKRRERLRAMRMEAQQQQPSSSSPSSQQQQQQLANPLLIDSNHHHQQSSAAARPRFDFYTDPMAAFSRTSHPPPYSGPKNSEMPLYGVHQMQTNYTPHQNIRPGGDPSYSPSLGQMGPGTPYFGHQGDQSYRPSPTASPMGFRSPSPWQQGSPSFSPGLGRGVSPNFSPVLGRGGSPYPVQGSPSFRPPPQGRGPWFSGNTSPGIGYGGGPSPSLGRGWGQWDGGRSPGGRGRGRGRDFNSQSRSYFDRSMVEDPWESLTPVIWRWNITEECVPNKWLSGQMTPSAKKARISKNYNNNYNKSNSKPSLAEFIAAAADEAVGDDV